MARRRWLWLGSGALALGLVASSEASGQPAAPSPADLLAQLHAAEGGAAWGGVEGVTAVGQKTSFGLKGPYRASEDLTTGRFVRAADYGLFHNAEGLDAAGRWRMDNSGRIHPLDSDEARTVAVTEAWLAARRYLFPERAKANFEALPPATDGGQVFDRILATPAGGRAVTLWIGRSDQRLGRATLQLSSHPETIRYRDYRPVGGVMLPFQILTENGDQIETGDARVERYSLEASASLSRPEAASADAAVDAPGGVAHAPFRLDSMSGFPVVEARVNGQGPLLFILDTGGHDILTPAAAGALGLPLSGSGFSLGAGQGSAPTQYTKVATLDLGEARMSDQPFIVLQLDLGQAADGQGRTAPISGIIGLELFERFTATLDYAAGRLTLSMPSPKTEAPGVPIRFTSDMPLIQASVDGRAGWFGLDTGNDTDVILYRAWVAAVGLPAWFEVSADVAGAGVGGPIAFRRGRAGALSLAGVEVKGVPVLLPAENMGGLSSTSEAGNIGESVLSHYVVTFDYAHERVRLDLSGTPIASPGSGSASR
jgi:hypothetical protein